MVYFKAQNECLKKRKILTQLSSGFLNMDMMMTDLYSSS